MLNHPFHFLRVLLVKNKLKHHQVFFSLVLVCREWREINYCPLTILITLLTLLYFHPISKPHASAALEKDRERAWGNSLAWARPSSKIRTEGCVVVLLSCSVCYLWQPAPWSYSQYGERAGECWLCLVHPLQLGRPLLPVIHVCHHGYLTCQLSEYAYSLYFILYVAYSHAMAILWFVLYFSCQRYNLWIH